MKLVVKQLGTIRPIQKHLMLLALLCTSLLSFGFEVPPIQGFVTDRAGVLSSRGERALKSLLFQLKEKTGTEIAILTMPDLDGETIEGASIKVTDKWKLGSTKADNGLLILLALTERKLRIEVGQGLEGSIPDAMAKRVIEDVMIPMIRKGDFDSAFLIGSLQLIRLAHPELNLDQFSNAFATQKSFSRPRPMQNGIISLLVFLYILLMIFSRRFRRAFFSSRGPIVFGGGGFGGGGFRGGFGGGFGGGGGFSGGGASGGW